MKKHKMCIDGDHFGGTDIRIVIIYCYNLIHIFLNHNSYFIILIVNNLCLYNTAQKFYSEYFCDKYLFFNSSSSKVINGHK